MSKVTLAAFLRPAETVEEEHPSKPKTTGNINDNIENNIKKGKQKRKTNQKEVASRSVPICLVTLFLRLWTLPYTLVRYNKMQKPRRNTYFETNIIVTQTWNLSKRFTRPNFRAKKFYTLKMRKWRLFSPAINSENASLSVIWASFG